VRRDENPWVRRRPLGRAGDAVGIGAEPRSVAESIPPSPRVSARGGMRTRSVSPKGEQTRPQALGRQARSGAQSIPPSPRVSARGGMRTRSVSP
jgi:hypothetical protein